MVVVGGAVTLYSPRRQESAPIVAGHTLFVVSSFPNILYALDLEKPGGALKWRFEPKPAASAQGEACCEGVNRGPTVSGGGCSSPQRMIGTQGAGVAASLSGVAAVVRRLVVGWRASGTSDWRVVASLSLVAQAAGCGILGVLPWGMIDNRPFLRCLNGLGLCLWRLERFEEAEALFMRLLWMSPSDNLGVRFLLPSVRTRKPWTANG
jgi:hypothetical protein